MQLTILTLLVDINDDQFPPEGYGCLIPTNTGGRKNPPRGPDSVTPTNKSHSGSNVNGQDMHNVIQTNHNSDNENDFYIVIHDQKGSTNSHSQDGWP